MVDSAAGDRMSAELARRQPISEQKRLVEETKRLIYPGNGYRVGWPLDGIGAWSWCVVIPGRQGETQRIEFVTPCSEIEKVRLNELLNARIVMRYAPDRRGEPWALACHE